MPVVLSRVEYLKTSPQSGGGTCSPPVTHGDKVPKTNKQIEEVKVDFDSKFLRFCE